MFHVLLGTFMLSIFKCAGHFGGISNSLDFSAIYHSTLELIKSQMCPGSYGLGSGGHKMIKLNLIHTALGFLCVYCRAEPMYNDTPAQAWPFLVLAA